MKCKTCKHWFTEDKDCYTPIIRPWHPVTYDEMTDAEIEEMFGFQVNYCNSPMVLFYERPQVNGCCVVDGSEYMARLITGPEFSCCNYEADNKANSADTKNRAAD